MMQGRSQSTMHSRQTIATKSREAGVSRLSIGFRHLVDWGKETHSSVVRPDITGPFSQTNSSLTQYLNYNMNNHNANNQ